MRLDDLDCYGVPEIIAGKRWLAHADGSDPGSRDPSVLAYYAIRRTAAGVSFERHDVDLDSGAGAAFAVADLDGDGRQDIVTANKKGLFVFRQRRAPHPEESPMPTPATRRLDAYTLACALLACLAPACSSPRTTADAAPPADAAGAADARAPVCRTAPGPLDTPTFHRDRARRGAVFVSTDRVQAFGVAAPR